MAGSSSIIHKASWCTPPLVKCSSLTLAIIVSKYWIVTSPTTHEFGSRGMHDNGQFNQPYYGIACGTNGDVYVTDHFNYCVQVFTASGQFICLLVKPESVWYPSGIAIDLLGTVYISDNKNLSVFDSKGQFIKRITTRQGVMSTLITNQRSLIGVAVGNTGNILLSCHLTIAVLC